MTALYRSDDTGAPVVTNAGGEIISLITACLVTGYGTKQGLGWTLEASTATTATYRNDPINGSGYYLKVTDDGLLPTAQIQGMDDLAGTNTFPLFLPQGFSISRGFPGQPMPWVLVGDAKSFTLWVSLFSTVLDPTANFAGVYFGDIYSNKPGDTSNVLIVGGTDPNDAEPYTNSFGLLSDRPLAAMASNFDGTRIPFEPDDSPGVDFAIPSKTNPNPLEPAVWGGFIAGSTEPYTIPYPEPLSGKLVASAVELLEAQEGATIAWYKRGQLRGLLCPWHHQPLTSLDTFVLAGNDYLVLNINPGDYAGQVFLQTSGSMDA